MTAESLVLITIDALRHDALSCVGPGFASTPRLDALASEGVLFEQAIANGPRTQSSFPSMMASLYPLAAGERRRLPRNAATVAEAASLAGLTTAGFNPSNPFLTRETGYDRGFGLFVDFWDTHDRHEPIARRGGLARVKKSIQDAVGRRSLGALMLMQALLLEEGGQYVTGRFLTDRALAWLGERDGPFFLWLHFMDVHYPYQPLPGRRGFADRLSYLVGLAGLSARRPGPAVRALRKLYGERVTMVDGLVGDLLDGLASLRLAESTAVIVTSDHGEQLGERGRWAHGPDLHDELIRVPLIVHVPDVSAPRRIDAQVELLGLAPTILDLLGLPTPTSFLGTSFAPLILSEVGGGSPTVFSEAMHSGRRRSRVGVADTYTVTSCRETEWKFIHDSEDDREELYDLRSDPSELVNLATVDRDRTARYRRLVEDHRRHTADLAATLDDDGEPGPDEDDAAVRRRLAALGYL